MSEDKARQAGSLGWKTRGSLLGDFEKYVLYSSTYVGANLKKKGGLRLACEHFWKPKVGNSQDQRGIPHYPGRGKEMKMTYHAKRETSRSRLAS